MNAGLALGLAATIALSPLAVADEDKKKDMPEETMGFVEWVVLQDTGLRKAGRTGQYTCKWRASNFICSVSVKQTQIGAIGGVQI